MIERALEARHERPDRGVKLAQHGPNLLGLTGLGKGGVAAQIAEHDNDVAAMALENALVAGRDDHLGELRREKALKPSDLFKLAELGRDPVLQRPVPTGQLRRLLLNRVVQR